MFFLRTGGEAELTRSRRRCKDEALLSWRDNFCSRTQLFKADLLTFWFSLVGLFLVKVPKG